MDSDGIWDNINAVQNDDQLDINKTIIDDESKIKTFRVKNYIPKRSTFKLLKLPHIISSVIIFILIIIIIVIASTKNKCATSAEYAIASEVNDEESEDIILSDGYQFWIYNLQKGDFKLFKKIENSTQAFVVDTRETLYWIATNSWKIFSLNQFKSGTEKNESLFFEGTGTKPLRKPSMALDSINHNLYIVDESIEGLVIINTINKYYALMFMELVKPRCIVLDAAKGFMFISSENEIKRADMDGNNSLIIIQNTDISAITLDHKGERIYWIHNYEYIDSSDYSGQQNQHLLTEFTSPIIDLTFLDGHLFWLKKSVGIQIKTIWSCKIQNGTCVNHSAHRNTISTATFMKTSGRSHNKSRRQDSLNYQNCEHISLATPNRQLSCACNMSSQLVFNTKCEPITEFILYTLNGDVRARILDFSREIIFEHIWPTPYFIESLSKKEKIDFDYDLENDYFYFSDDKTIYKIKLKEKNPQQEVVLTIDSGGCFINSLAYDWLTENMYFVKTCYLGPDMIYLIVFNVKNGAGIQKTLVELPLLSENIPCSLAVHPKRGILFLANFDTYNREISVDQLMMNGTLNIIFNINHAMLYTNNLNGALTIDYEEDRLYWLLNNVILRTSFNNADTEIDLQVYSNFKSISINRQWIYVSDYNRVYRINKKTGTLYIPGARFAVDAGIRIISQTQVNENPCRINNGGCEQFCFYKPKKICGCGDNFLLKSEGQCVRDDT